MIAFDPVDFLSLLGSYRAREATDLKDKLYGLLGLAHNMETYIEKIDYTITTEQAYTDWAWSMIRNSGNLDIFGFLVPGEGRLILPSWVPDWSAVVDRNTAEKLVRRRAITLPRLYNACNHSRTIVIARNKILTVKGCIVDVLKEIDGQTVHHIQQAGTSGYAHEFDVISSWFSEIHGMHDASRRTHAFWTTMCGGLRLSGENHSFRTRSQITDFSPFVRWKSSGAGSLIYPDGTMDYEVEAISRCYTLVSFRRKLAITRRESIGWAPKSALVGDVVAILTGGRTPIVLRPGIEGYTVVGDGYIYGIMNGEGMPDEESLEDINLA